MYYLTPCLPLKFGIDGVFFDKLQEKGIDNRTTIDLLTVLNAKKQIISNDSTTILVLLNEKDLGKFVPELQGPVNNPLLDEQAKVGFQGLLALDTYPQVFLSHNLRSEAFVQVSFDEPTPCFKNEDQEEI